MKICVALHQCMDLGGIINHTEQLIGGLKELGHEVHLKEIIYKEHAKNRSIQDRKEIGPSGIPFHQGKGWEFSFTDRIPYGTTAQARGAQQILSKYDLIIWTVPVPPKNKNNLGNNLWPMLYDLPERVKQIAFIHDGNARRNSSHIYHILDHLSGIACVHECAFNGSSFIPIPRAIVLNPQENPVREIPDWSFKKPGFINMQTFKAWKHVHELIGSIAFMPPKKQDELREVAGKGIEYQYMTSIDKCKPQYFHEDGRRFWDAAVLNGMIHHDYWNTQEVDDMLAEARVLVDPSWSKAYSQVGGHWNRVVVDAMIRGAIPVAHSLGMGRSLFKPGHHYVNLTGFRDMQDYAEIVLEAGNMSFEEASKYHLNARGVLELFERKTVADRLVRFSHLDIEHEVGEFDKSVYDKYRDIMFNHFGIL